MLKFFKTQIVLAVFFLVSMSAVCMASDIAIANDENQNNVEEKWRLPIGSNNVKYGTKYTIILNGEKHEYYLEYKGTIPENKIDAKFKGHYWNIKTNDLEKDENFIYDKNKTKYEREDVIEFLEIKDEKLAALIKEGYEFSLYLEPYYNYKKGKWSDTYRSTIRELYSMLPEAIGDKLSYENARDNNGSIIKSKITGVEFLREKILKVMKSIGADNLEKYSDFKNEYKNTIKSEMLNKGWIAYFFEEEKIKVGEFIKNITLSMWPDFVYVAPKEGVHELFPYVEALNRIILNKDDYNSKILESNITRKEAARLLCLVYANKHGIQSLDNKEEYIITFNDDYLITDFAERMAVDECIKFGIMSGYDDGTFKPNKELTKEEASQMITLAISD